jgi:hypothetical protein
MLKTDVGKLFKGRFIRNNPHGTGILVLGLVGTI